MRRKHLFLFGGVAIFIALFVLWYTNTLAGWFFQLGLPRAALLTDHSDAELAFALGDYYYGGGTFNLPLAQEAYTKAIAIDPTVRLGEYQLARVLFVKADFKDALIAIDAQLTNRPDYLRALYIRGLIEAYSSNFPAAAADLTRFTKWAPTEWAGYNDLAWVLAEEKQYSQAEQTLNRAFALAYGASQNPWLWDNIGVQQLNLRQYMQAVNSFQKATQYAARLTPDTWHQSYPGDNAAGSAEALAQFRTAIEINLNQAQHDLAS